MSVTKRRNPSRLMAAMAGRVEETRSKLLTADSAFSHSFEVGISAVHPDSDQARKIFEPTAIASLAESLTKQGQLQPILVRHHPDIKGSWLIIAGERRWQAARSLGWTSILAIEYTGEHEIAALVENLQRVDLNVLEEARAIRRLIELNGWSQRATAQAVGRSASDINGLLKLLELPESFLSHVLNSEHPPSRNLLIELARVPAGPVQNEVLEQAKTGDLTFAALRQATSKNSALKVPNPDELSLEGKPTPRLGGKRRLDGKAIKRFHEAFDLCLVESFTEDDRRAFLDFADSIHRAFDPKSK